MLQIGESKVSARELLEALPDLYFFTDPSGEMVYLCSKFEELFGLTLENQREISAKIIHPNDIGATLLAMGAGFQNTTPIEFDYRLKLKTGKYRWFNVKMGPIKRNKVLIGWAGHVMDVHDAREILETLQTSEQRKDEFIGMASHELKTPITSAKMILQIVQKQLKEDKKSTAAPLLDKAEIQINRLTRLTNDLLDVSKIKSGKLDLIKEVVDFDSFFIDTVSLLPSNHHKIDAKSTTHIKIAIDKARLAQVLNNLIQNAIKYSPNSNRVTIRAITDGTKITCSVRDYGIGIPKEKQANIFDRFYRVEEQVAETFSGLGLGLYIAAEIVHLHGGRIWVESKVNKGSIFYFTLPR